MQLRTRNVGYEGSSRKLCGIPVAWIYGIISLVLLFFLVAYSLHAKQLYDQSTLVAAKLCSYSLQEFEQRALQADSKYRPPHVNVFFLKTHKCAGSTLQNILMRFGDKRNLSFVLPKKDNYIGHPQKFNIDLAFQKYIPPVGFNILCHHLRLDPTEVIPILPGSTVFITILRDPSTLFQSLYDYYNISYHTNLEFEDFMSYDKAMDDFKYDRVFSRIGRNQMLFDMGYDYSVWDNDTLINSAIFEMDQFFDLVLIFEFFEESMILMKYKLSWNMEDILYFMHNRRQVNESRNENFNLTEKIRDYNRADYMLYSYFYQKFQRELDVFGRERMAEEVKNLQIWNKLWYDHCVKKLASSRETVPEETKAYSSKVYSFVLNDEPIASLCKELGTEELQYTDTLRKKQKSMFW